MPVKRKAASTSKAAPSPKKRATRAPSSSDLDDASSSPAPAAKNKSKSKDTKSSSTKAAKGKATKAAKGKKKEQQEIVLSSDSDADDSDVVIEQPKKRKARATVTKPKASSSTKSKATAATRMPLLGSTSTPAESAPKGQKKDKKKKPRELPFEEALPAWFAQFADQAEPGKMDGDGIEKLFDDMGLSMDGAYPLILAWKAGAKPGTFGAFYLNDFERAFRQDRIDSSDKLKKFLVQQEKSLLESRAGSKGKTAESIDTDAEEEPDAAFDAANEAFRQFYTFLLPFFRAEGAKTLPADTAKAMWSVVLAPKYELAKGFVDFAEDQGDQFKAVSTDLWTQLLDFCETVAPDLTGWSEDDAWPSAIDAFVEWKKEKEGAAA